MPDSPVETGVPPQANTVIAPREVIIARKDEDIRKAARELASKQVSDEARKGSALNPLNWTRKLRYAFGGKAIRQQRIRQHEQQFRQNDNAYGDVNVQKATEEDALKALRTQLEYKRTTGEDLTEIDKIEEANNEVRQLIVDQVIKPYLNGQITGTPDQIQRQFQERLTKLVSNSQDRSNPDFTDTARQQISRIFGKKGVASRKLADAFVVKELIETANWVKQNIDAGEFAQDQIQKYVIFHLANPSWAAESEADLTRVDRIVRWVEEKVPAGGLLLSPTVMGVAVGIVASTGEVLLTKAPGFFARRLVPIIAPILGPIVGGVVSALKRNLELKQNRAQLQAEQTYNEQTPPLPQTGKTLMGRLSGEYRRTDLERYKYDTANATDLRTNVDRLLAQDLTIAQNREELIKAVADIEARLNFSNRQQIDLVTFESRGRVRMGRMQLTEAKVLAYRKLIDAGMSGDEMNNLKNAALTERYNYFTQNKAQQDREFRNYGWRQSAGAFAFGATVGFASGIVTQEGLAFAARHFHWGEGGGIAGLIFRKGETSAEKMFNWARGIAGAPRVDFAGGATAALSVDALRNLYNNPTNVAIPGKNIWLAIGSDHHASLKDALGNPIPTPPIEITKDGHLMVLGNMDKVPTPIKDFLKSAGWTENLTSDPSFNLQEKMTHAYQMGTPGHETFRYGNFNIDLESGANHQMSMTLYPGTNQEVMIHGFLEMDTTGKPDLNIDGSFNGNQSLTPDKIALIRGELAKSGWPDPKIDHVHIPGKDQIVQVNEYLKSRGALQPTARELWHDNQTPMRFVNGRWIGADGKELQFYHRMTPDGKVELDFSKMESNFQNGAWRNWDYTADNQYNRVVNDIVKQPDGSKIFNNFEIMITPNEQANSLREAVIFNGANHPELRQGFLRIDINSPEARAFFKLDQNGKPVFNRFGNFQGASYIEVAHKQANNLRTILSTTQGDGITQTVIPGKDIDYDVFHLTAPQATELIPPQPEMAPPVWFDVIPTRFQPLPPGVPGEEKVPPPPPPPGEVIPTPYEGPAGGYEASQVNKETLDAISKAESLVRNSPLILEREKDAAAAKARDFINTRESQTFGPNKTATTFQEVWDFIINQSDPDALKADDGSVPETTRDRITPVIQTMTFDANEQLELGQVVGKFLNTAPNYLIIPDSEQAIRVIIRSYQTTKSIIEGA